MYQKTECMDSGDNIQGSGQLLQFLEKRKKLQKGRYSAAEFLILGFCIWSHLRVMFQNIIIHVQQYMFQ